MHLLNCTLSDSYCHSSKLYLKTTSSKDSISWLYSCDKSSYIRSVYSQCHVDSLKYTDQNVNNKNVTQVSKLYVHVSFCLNGIRSCLKMCIGGHGHMICMGVVEPIIDVAKKCIIPDDL